MGFNFGANIISIIGVESFGEVIIQFLLFHTIQFLKIKSFEYSKPLLKLEKGLVSKCKISYASKTILSQVWKKAG
jgi:hypothetical protein